MKYLNLAYVYDNLEKNSKILKKIEILSKFFKNAPKEDLPYITHLAAGRVLPEWDQREIGFASKMMIKTISRISGFSTKEVENLWKDLGDLGLVAEKVIKNKKQKSLVSSDLSIKEVYETIRQLPNITGKGTVDKKISIVSKLLSLSKPIEAKYIVRTILGQLRIGVGEGIIRDSLSKAFNVPSNEIQEAFNLTNDFSIVAEAILKGNLKDVKLVVGKPIKVMLAQKENSIESAFKRIGKPAAFEYKYDGFRLQCHIKGKDITLFTRRLDNVTKQFPDIVEILKTSVKCKECILDSEAIGITKNGKPRKFQEVSRRIKRKYDIDKLVKELPMNLNVFDVVYYNGKNLINKPFSERRKLLEKIIIPKKNKINLAKQLITSDIKLATKFYKEALKMGHEGVMVKNLKAPYKPGKRVGYMVKVKPIMETLDLVITGAQWGEGKRSHWLSSFILSCKGKDSFLEIGKMGSGLTEAQFESLTKELKKYVISSSGKDVVLEPKIVVEVAYEEIQKSPKYSSGFALRFPRLIRIRDDKGPEEASSLEYVKQLFNSQKRK